MNNSEDEDSSWKSKNMHDMNPAAGGHCEADYKHSKGSMEKPFLVPASLNQP